MRWRKDGGVKDGGAVIVDVMAGSHQPVHGQAVTKGAPNGSLHEPLDFRLVRTVNRKLTEDAKGARVERVAEEGQLRPCRDLRAGPRIHIHVPTRFEI